MRRSLTVALVTSGLVTSFIAVVGGPASADPPVVSEHGGAGLAGANPRSVTMGSDGALWFAETGTGTIGRLDPDTDVTTRFSTGITAGRLPTAIVTVRGSTSAEPANLWFLEEPGNALGRITPAGVVTEFAVPTPAAGLTDLATRTNEVWFTESAVGKIGRITTTTGAVAEFDAPMGSVPTGITFAPNNYYVTLKGTDQIARISTTGVFTVLGPGTMTAGAGPTAIAYGPDRRLWFTESTGGRIGAMSLDGVTVQEFGLSAGTVPVDIVAGADGAMWFTVADGRIGRIDVVSGAITFFAAGTGGSPVGIAPGPDGALWYADSARSTLGRIEPDGGPDYVNTTPLAAAGEGGLATTYPSPIESVEPFRRITDVTVQLNGLDHNWFGDFDVMLAGPGGHAVTVLSDVSEGHVAQRGITMRLNDGGAVFPVPAEPLVSGVYQPADRGNAEVTFPDISPGVPAPVPDSATLDVFDHLPASGTWGLYVRDDDTLDVGGIRGGWGLKLDTEAIPTPVITMLTPTSPSTSNTVFVSGTAEAGSTVALHTGADCSAPPVKSGTPEQFADGLRIDVVDDSVTPIRARITDQYGNLSACSPATTYVEATTAPQTTITKKPARTVRTKAAKVKVAFAFKAAPTSPVTFQCSLDKGPWRACKTGAAYRVKPGKHTFAVRATRYGLTDASPAAYSFKVVKKKKRKK